METHGPDYWHGVLYVVVYDAKFWQVTEWELSLAVVCAMPRPLNSKTHIVGPVIQIA